MTAGTATAARVAAAPQHWYRDPVGCLHSTLAMVLLHAGHAPLPVLGANWEFRYRPGDVRPEEFYYPCRYPGDPARSIAPSGGIASRWCQPYDTEPVGSDTLEPLVHHLAAGGLPIVAVDNFHLPFRPAYGDVHAAHLVVVYGIDDDSVHLADPVPPAFAGPVATGEFLQAWTSANPRADQDAFFTAAPIGRRWLAVDTPESPLRLDEGRLAQALRDNVDRFAGAGDPPGWTGLDGLRRYLAELLDRADAADPVGLDEAYPFGWAMQAQAYVHGELLGLCAGQWGRRELAEAGRAVHSVAYAWTGLRMTAAHRRDDPAAAVPDLRRHADRLRHAYERAVSACEVAEQALR